MILRRFSRPLLLLLLLSVGTAAGAWQESAYSRGKEKPRPNTEAVEHGRSQFLKTCAFCHGPEANGGSSGPDLMRSAVVRHDEHGNLIGEVIRDGRPDKGMPAFQLTDAEITAVAAFLHYRVKQSDGTSPKEPGAAYSAAKLLIGNAAAGKKFFYGAGGCAACHSITGDLAGIARKYPAAELQARFLYPPGQHLTAIVTEHSGKQYTGEVRLLTNYDVAIVDRAGWYRSWPLSAIKLQIRDPLAAHRRLLSKFTDADMHNMLAFLETLK